MQWSVNFALFIRSQYGTFWKVFKWHQSSGGIVYDPRNKNFHVPQSNVQFCHPPDYEKYFLKQDKIAAINPECKNPNHWISCHPTSPNIFYRTSPTTTIPSLSPSFFQTFLHCTCCRKQKRERGGRGSEIGWCWGGRPWGQRGISPTRTALHLLLPSLLSETGPLTPVSPCIYLSDDRLSLSCTFTPFLSICPCGHLIEDSPAGEEGKVESGGKEDGVR